VIFSAEVMHFCGTTQVVSWTNDLKSSRVSGEGWLSSPCEAPWGSVNFIKI